MKKKLKVTGSERFYDFIAVYRRVLIILDVSIKKYNENIVKHIKKHKSTRSYKNKLNRKTTL